MNRLNLVFTIILALASVELWAIHGRVKFAKGKPYRIRDGKQVEIKKGNDIRDGDEIILKTKKDLVIIKFGNDYKSTMKISEPTKISFPKKDQQRKTSVYMDVGNVIVDYLDVKERNFEIKTKTAAMAVRGTKWMTNVDKAGNVSTSVLRGAVSVSSLRTNRSYIVGAGQTSFVRRTGFISRPNKRVNLQGINWGEDPKAGDLSQNTEILQKIDSIGKQIDPSKNIGPEPRLNPGADSKPRSEGGGNDQGERPPVGSQFQEKLDKFKGTPTPPPPVDKKPKSSQTQRFYNSTKVDPSKITNQNINRKQNIEKRAREKKKNLYKQKVNAATQQGLPPPPPPLP